MSRGPAYGALLVSREGKTLARKVTSFCLEARQAPGCGLLGLHHPWHTRPPSKASGCESPCQRFGVEPPPNQNVCVFSSESPRRPLLLRIPCRKLRGPSDPLAVMGEGWETKIAFQLPDPEATSQGSLWKCSCVVSREGPPLSLHRGLPPPRVRPTLGRARSEQSLGRERSRAAAWGAHGAGASTSELAYPPPHPPAPLPSQGSRRLREDKIKSNSPALTSARGLNSPAAA